MSKESKKLVPLFLSVIYMAESECFANKEENVYSPYMQTGGMRLFNVKEYNASIGVDTFLPLWQQNQSDLVFVNARLGDRSGPAFEVNLHFGYRRLSSSAQKIYGIYGGFDRKKTGLNNYFNQIILGAEHWNKNWFIGGNVYYPIGNSSKSLSNPAYELRKNQYDVYNVWLIMPAKEKALAGLDTEVGYEFTKGLAGYVGGYYFAAKETDTVYGPRARITYDWSLDNGNRILGVFDKIGVEAGIQRDTPRGTTCYVSINARIGLSSVTNNVLEDVSRHMVDPVRRDVDIVSGVSKKQESVLRDSGNAIIDITSCNDNLYAKQNHLAQLRNIGFKVLEISLEKPVVTPNLGVKLEEKPSDDTATVNTLVPLKGSNEPAPALNQAKEAVQDDSAFVKVQEVAQTPTAETKASEPVVTQTQEVAQTPTTETKDSVVQTPLVETKISALDSAPVQVSASIKEVVQGNNASTSENPVVKNEPDKQAQEVLQSNNTSPASVSIQPEKVSQSNNASSLLSPYEQLKIENISSRASHKEENIFIKKMREVQDEIIKQKAEDEEIAYIENYYNKQPRPIDQEKATRLENRRKIEAARTNVELFESVIGLAADIDIITVMVKAGSETLKDFDSTSKDLNGQVNTKTKDEQNSYEILGVKPGVTKDELKKARNEQMLLFHPDKHPKLESDYYHAKARACNAAYEDIKQLIDNKNNIEITMPVLPLTVDKSSLGQNFIVRADQIPVQQSLVKENFILRAPQVVPVLPLLANKPSSEQNFIVKAVETTTKEPAPAGLEQLVTRDFTIKIPQTYTNQLLVEQNLLLKAFQEGEAQSLIRKDSVKNPLIIPEKPLAGHKPGLIVTSPQEQLLLEQNPVIIDIQAATEQQEPLEHNFIVRSSKIKKAGVIENSDRDSGISTPQPDNLNGFMSEDYLAEADKIKNPKAQIELTKTALLTKKRTEQMVLLSEYEKKLSSAEPKGLMEKIKYQFEKSRYQFEKSRYQKIAKKDASSLGFVVGMLEDYTKHGFGRYQEEVRQVLDLPKQKPEAIEYIDMLEQLINKIPNPDIGDPIANIVLFFIDNSKIKPILDAYRDTIK